MWSDQLNIVGTITTGNITPYFKNEYMISSQQSDGQVNVWFEDQNRDGYNETMRVAGQIEEGESGYIKFSISNGGTLPVKLQKKLQKKQFLHVKHTIKPDEITNAKIDFSHLIVKGNREQNWTIPFVQWNKKRP